MKRNALDPKRLGRCYELAGRYVMDLRRGRRPVPQGDVVLVHGSIQGFGNPRIGHAWVDLGSKIYEPITDEEWDAYLFSQMFNAIPEASYPWDELSTMLAVYQHWGPWHHEPPVAKKRRRKK